MEDPYSLANLQRRALRLYDRILEMETVEAAGRFERIRERIREAGPVILLRTEASASEESTP